MAALSKKVLVTFNRRIDLHGPRLGWTRALPARLNSPLPRWNRVCPHNLQVCSRYILVTAVLPTRQVCQILRGALTSRSKSVSPRPPPPCLGQIRSKISLYQLQHILSDIWQQFEAVSGRYGVRYAASSFHLHKMTHPLSPVARIKFLHLGCSQIKRLASAVSVHQHIALFRSGRSWKAGMNLAIAFRIVTSEASGYVSVGCSACDLGTLTRLSCVAPKGRCDWRWVKPGNSSHILMIPSLGSGRQQLSS